MARILVVDDNADLLQMIRLLLEERGGHQVILTAEGTDALAKAAATPPDLAIVDVMMPGMTGYEVCRKLRAAPATARIPIIILTARGQAVDEQAALSAGADLYIAKPVTMAELLERVNTLLAKSQSPAATLGMVAFLSLRGGVGATTLAVNMAMQQADSACLADLCTSSGNGALHLGLRPEPNWSTLFASDANPTAADIERHILGHPSGLQLLAAPFVPAVGAGPSRQAVQSSLAALGEQFDRVIIDLPSALDDLTMAALEIADRIVLVMTSDPPSIQATVGTLHALKGLAEKTLILVNQVSPGPPPSLQTIERVLRRAPHGAIPHDPAQASALAQGKPLALTTPGSPLAQALAQFQTALR